jgi:two-component system cell cycle response regulator
VSLRLRLSLAFVFVVLAPLLLAGLLIGRGVPGFGGEAARQRVAASATAIADAVATRCTLAGTAAGKVALEATTATPQQAVDDAFGGAVSYAAVVSTAGTVAAQVGQLPPAAQSVVDAKSVLALGSCMSGGATPYAVVAQVRLSGGDAVAVVAINFDEATLTSWRDLSDGDVTLVSGGQVVVTTASPDAAARYAAHAADAGARMKVISVGGRLLSAVVAGPGRPVTVVVTAGPGLGISSLTSNLAAVLAAAVVLAVGLGWQLARATTRPLTQLALAARRIADGDLDTPVPDLGGGDEISQLAGAFDEMTGELRRSIGALQDSRDELRGNLSGSGTPCRAPMTSTGSCRSFSTPPWSACMRRRVRSISRTPAAVPAVTCSSGSATVLPNAVRRTARGSGSGRACWAWSRPMASPSAAA